jgi:hypothetical protein
LTSLTSPGRFSSKASFGSAPLITTSRRDGTSGERLGAAERRERDEQPQAC